MFEVVGSGGDDGFGLHPERSAGNVHIIITATHLIIICFNLFMILYYHKTKRKSSVQKPKAPIFIGALGFIEGCYVCRIIRRRLRNVMRFQTTAEVFLVVFFGSSLNNCIGKSFAVFNEEDAENAENKHDGAVNEE